MKRQEEAHYARIRELAGAKTPIAESNNLSASTLVDYKRCNDGSALGIVMENHKYFIKTSISLNENLTAKDFSYIGGLENKLEKRYDSVATADKHRNMYIASLDEAFSRKKVVVNEVAQKEVKTQFTNNDFNGNKKTLNEVKVISVNQPNSTKKRSEERITLLNENAKNAIAKALGKKNDISEDVVDDKLGDAEAKLANAPAPTQVDAPIAEPELPMGDEMPQDGEDTGAEPQENGQGLTKKEAQKRIGKLVADLKASEELNSADLRELTNTVIGSLDYDDVDINKIIDKLEDKETEGGVEPEKRPAPVDGGDDVNTAIDAQIDSISEDGDDADDSDDELLLDINTDDDEVEGDDDEESSEDEESEEGTFDGYLDSRGYETLEGCDNDEIAGLIMGYMYQIDDTNALGAVAKFIQNDEIKSKLIELGGEEFVETLENITPDEDDEIESDGEIEIETEPEDGEVDENPGTVYEDGGDDEESFDLDLGAESEAEPQLAPPQASLPTTGNKSINIDLNNNTVGINISEDKIRQYVKNRMSEMYDGDRKAIVESKESKPKNALDKIILEELSMFKPSEKENSIVNEKAHSEEKLREYIQTRIAELKSGRRTGVKLYESKKSDKLKKLDETIEIEYKKIIANKK